MRPTSPIAIIGAGPYGLSLAAHLRGLDVSCQVFGRPMHSWRTQMPQGMKLRSAGILSSISDPDESFPLSAYCAERGLPYADTGLAIPLETFVGYGRAFQRRFVPGVDEREVIDLGAARDGFMLRLSDGETVPAHKVVIAVGLGHFAYVPEELAGLPAPFLSHSSHHTRVDRFRGRSVLVVGAGASAIDLAMLLHQAEADVRVIGRRKRLELLAPPERRWRGLAARLLSPRIESVPAGISEEVGTLLHRVLPDLRLHAVQRHLVPEAGWYSWEEIENRVPLILGARLKGANLGARPKVWFSTADGVEQVLEADHVIAATGYRVDLRRLPFLEPGLLARVRMVDHAPVLSPRFETSQRGLFFIGPAAARGGGLMRMTYGVGDMAHRLAPYLAQEW